MYVQTTLYMKMLNKNIPKSILETTMTRDSIWTARHKVKNNEKCPENRLRKCPENRLRKVDNMVMTKKVAGRNTTSISK